MGLDQSIQRQVRNDVAVVHQNGLATDEVGDIADAAPRIEQNGLMTENDRYPAPLAFRERFPVAICPVMCVDDETPDARGP